MKFIELGGKSSLDEINEFSELGKDEKNNNGFGIISPTKLFVNLDKLEINYLEEILKTQEFNIIKEFYELYFGFNTTQNKDNMISTLTNRIQLSRTVKNVSEKAKDLLV